MTLFLTVLLLCLIPLNGVSLWAFLRFQPPGRYVMFFNLVTFLIAPATAAFFSIWLHTQLPAGVPNSLVPLLAALGWPASFPVLLLAFGLVRAVIFQQWRPPAINPANPAMN